MMPAMESEGLAAFKDALENTSVYMEYGCGGSTVLAAKSGVKTIFSVDTSGEWVENIRKELSGMSLQLNLEHCDLGPVGDWGWPRTRERISEYVQYSALPWVRAKKLNLTPQLILIDGRFRVASFLFTVLNARVGAKILFDDYLDRPQYHVVEQFCSVEKTFGRMALFIKNNHFSVPDLAMEFANYSIRPD